MTRTRSFLDERRETLAESAEPWNGIAGIDVDTVDQTKLTVRFVKSLPGEPAGVPEIAALTAADISVEGGDRIRGIGVVTVTATGTKLNVVTDRIGDLSTYTLRIEEDIPGFDSILRKIDFSFRVQCLEDDCEAEPIPPAPLPPGPRLNYLARDYESYKQLIYDRMSVTAPEWTERNAASLGVTLVEWLAYLGDELSYKLDVVDTEFSLSTARQRRSAARHARLVGYRMHNGISARVQAQVILADGIDNLTVDPDSIAFSTQSTELDQVVVPKHQMDEAMTHGAIVFEPMHELVARRAHHSMVLHHWGDPDFILRRGATAAWIQDDTSGTDLKKGDLIVLVQSVAPATERQGDVDSRLRHTVRLSSDASAITDPIGLVLPGAPPQPLSLRRMTWSVEDALPFDLCVGYREEVILAHAHGNIVVADHGHTLKDTESLGVASSQVDPERAPAPGEPDEPKPLEKLNRAKAFRPRLMRKDLSFAVPLDSAGSAKALRAMSADQANAAIVLKSTVTGETWQARSDLLGSGPEQRDFVPEVEGDGATHVRFGRGRAGKPSQNGRQPSPEDGVITARYRVGVGLDGNIGADALMHVGTTGTATGNIAGVRNYMPAFGGQRRETIEEVSQRAPASFHQQQRAVTLDDYESLLNARPDIQRSKARKRWLGGWSAIFLTVDRTGGLPLSAEFKNELIEWLESYRMMGHELSIDEPLYAPLEIALRVCVSDDLFREDVAVAVEEAFSAGYTRSGRRGFFHPDVLSFGDTLHLSTLYETALQIDGVEDVMVESFQRATRPGPQGIDDGLLKFEAREIPILANNPNRPDEGRLTITAEGGR